MTSTTSSYLALTKNLAKAQATTAAQPEVRNDTAYYLANIGKVTTIQQFVGNYRLFTYAMKAFGLEDMENAKGLVTKVLQGGVTSSGALANTLSDKRYKALATALDFAGKGAAATQSTAATTGVTAKYVEQSLEDEQSNTGVELALYFKRNASSVTNVYGLLADKNILKVVQTAFGLPSSAGTNIDAEASTLSKLVKMSDLQDPTKVDRIAQRFTAMYDLTGQNTSAAATSVAQIFGGSTTTGFSASLLLSMQSLKVGGA